ncbi:MAG: Cof-type HAD-IIB family hydrolase [Oscillospiraceae bacterium]
MTAKNINEMLVVSDIDGTLLQAGYGIPKENIDAIDRFVERGGLFTVATGRSVESVRKYVDWINMSVPAILCNGAVLYDYKTERVLYNRTLEPSARAVVNEIKKVFPEIGIEIHTVEGITAVAMNECVLNHTAVEHIPFTLSDLDSVADGWNKVLFTDVEGKIEQVVKFVERKKDTNSLFNRFNFVMTSKIYYELIPNDIGKGEGLKRLAELLNIKMENTVAIGDYYNDLPLFEVAGYTAAVSDAPTDIKRMTDVTVKPCLQGGVGELLDSLEAYCDGYIQLKFDMI